MKPFTLSMIALVESILNFILIIFFYFSMENSIQTLLLMILLLGLQISVVIIAGSGEKTPLGIRIVVISLLTLSAISATIIATITML